MNKISPICYIYKTEILETDWEKTPASVKTRMEEMKQLIEEWGKAKAELEAKEQELLEKLNRTSKNSSSPPSADPLNVEKKAVKKKSGLKVGGQPGHKGAVRYLYPESDCAKVINLKPEFNRSLKGNPKL